MLAGPPFTTQRLTLRRMRPADAELQHTLWEQRDARVPEHRRIDANGKPTVTDIALWISREEHSDRRFHLLTVVESSTGNAIGYCGLNPDARDHRAAELAYELLVSAHGQGYATEAAIAIIAWARQLGLRRMTADVWEWNTPSLRVLEKLGFVEGDRDGMPLGPNIRLQLDLDVPEAG